MSRRKRRKFTPEQRAQAVKIVQRTPTEGRFGEGRGRSLGEGRGPRGPRPRVVSVRGEVEASRGPRPRVVSVRGEVEASENAGRMLERRQGVGALVSWLVVAARELTEGERSTQVCRPSLATAREGADDRGYPGGGRQRTPASTRSL
jgi:hypothetical protein